MRNLLFFLSFFCFKSLSLSQENNIWYFGSNAGVDFNSGSPVSILDGMISTTEGVACMSNSMGEILFYTNGVTVFNRNHVIMTNGNGLQGDVSSSQSCIIVKRPLSDNIYYIFTADANIDIFGIRYSEVDLSMSAGLGAVTANKNIPLYTPSCEKLTAVRHCNNEDIWVISHDWGSNQFRTWRVTSAGVNSIPVLSTSGSIINGQSTASFGQMKSNLFGNKIANANYVGNNRVEIHDFNNSTGIVSGGYTLSIENGAYGIEFSPSSRFLYAATNNGNLVQYDLCNAGQRRNIASLGPFLGSLQLASDGKIYCSTNTNFLSVINFPENVGVACGFTSQNISLSGRNSRFGLPNFCPFYNNEIEDFTFISDCLEVEFNSPILSLNCLFSFSPPVYYWDFGDGNYSNLNNPTHTYNGFNSYNVNLNISQGCYNINLNKIVAPVDSCCLPLNNVIIRNQ